MGYFDYLEESVAQQREAQFFDAYAKKGFWIGVGAFCALIATIVLFCFVQIGSIVWLDGIMVASIVCCAFSMFYSFKTIRIAKKKEKTSPLASFSFIWALFFCLINVILIVINTWVYFV